MGDLLAPAQIAHCASAPEGGPFGLNDINDLPRLTAPKPRADPDIAPVVTNHHDERQRGRITLAQDTLTYRDRRIEGFDAAALPARKFDQARYVLIRTRLLPLRLLPSGSRS